jgi:hypothetical protein
VSVAEQPVQTRTARCQYRDYTLDSTCSRVAFYRVQFFLVNLMQTSKERYVVDEQGNPVAVLLEIEVFQQLMEAFEELEAIRAYDEAKASGEKPIPLEQAIEVLEHAPS